MGTTYTGTEDPVTSVGVPIGGGLNTYQLAASSNGLLDPAIGDMGGGAAFGGGSAIGGQYTFAAPLAPASVTPTLSGGAVYTASAPPAVSAFPTTVVSAPTTATNVGNTTVTDVGNTTTNVAAAKPTYMGGVPTTPNGPGFVQGPAPYQQATSTPLSFAPTPLSAPTPIMSAPGAPGVSTAAPGMLSYMPAQGGPGAGQPQIMPQSASAGGAGGAGGPAGMGNLPGGAPMNPNVQRMLQGGISNGGPLGGGNPVIASNPGVPGGLGNFGNSVMGGYNPNNVASDGGGGGYPPQGGSDWAPDGVNNISPNGQQYRPGAAQTPQNDPQIPQSALAQSQAGIDPNSLLGKVVQMAGLVKNTNPLTGVPYGSEVAAQFADERDKVHQLQGRVDAAQDKMMENIADFSANPTGRQGGYVQPPDRRKRLDGTVRGSWRAELQYARQAAGQVSQDKEWAAVRANALSMDERVLNHLEAALDKHMTNLNELGQRMVDIGRQDIDRAVEMAKSGHVTDFQRSQTLGGLAKMAPGPAKDVMIANAAGSDPEHAQAYKAMAGIQDEGAAEKLAKLQMANQYARDTYDMRKQKLQGAIAEQQASLTKFNAIKPYLKSMAQDRASLLSYHNTVAKAAASFAAGNQALSQQIKKLEISSALTSQQSKEAQSASAEVGKYMGLWKMTHDPMLSPEDRLSAQKQMGALYPNEKDPMDKVPQSVVNANNALSAFAVKGLDVQATQNAMAAAKYPNIAGLLQSGQSEAAAAAAKAQGVGRDDWTKLYAGFTQETD